MQFDTTHWSCVLSARDLETSRGREALAELCETYWFPLYTYVRRRGYAPEEARELTQEFFTRLIEKNYLKQVRAERGRFRTFLLTAMGNFLANEWDRSQAIKRGGGQVVLSLDFLKAERILKIEGVSSRTPEDEYQRKWAMALLDRVLERLQQEMERSGKGVRFELLKDYLVGDGRGRPCAETGAKMGMSEGAVKTAIHRMRARYGELIREEIAHTVATPSEVNRELKLLLQILGGG